MWLFIAKSKLCTCIFMGINQVRNLKVSSFLNPCEAFFFNAAAVLSMKLFKHILAWCHAHVTLSSKLDDSVQCAKTHPQINTPRRLLSVVKYHLQYQVVTVIMMQLQWLRWNWPIYTSSADFFSCNIFLPSCVNRIPPDLKMSSFLCPNQHVQQHPGNSRSQFLNLPKQYENSSEYQTPSSSKWSFENR